MEVKVGDRIKIIDVEYIDSNGNIDHQSKNMIGRQGVVEYIDSLGQLHGTWGGLSVIPEKDKFEII